MNEVEELLHRGYTDVVDADLSDYFGSIPHAELLKSVARRVVDRRVLHLIKMWLECPVEDTDERGRKRRTTEAKDTRRGIPQGSPISPLLANLYMRRFVLAWKQRGLEHRLGSRIVTYADDLVICCRRGNAEQALSRFCQVTQLSTTMSGMKQELSYRGYRFPPDIILRAVWLYHRFTRAPILWRLPGRGRRSLSMFGIQTDH